MRTLLARFIFGLSALALLATAALACTPGPIPAKDQRNFWFCKNDGDTAIVFMHGLFSNAREAWLKEKSADTGQPVFWPQLATQDKRLNGASVYLAGFLSKGDGKDYGVRQAANEVFDAMDPAKIGTGGPLDKETIIFVAHSLGGIVVRDLLVRRAEQFKAKRIGLLLVASPSGGSDYARVASYLLSSSDSRLLVQLTPDSDILNNLDMDFRELLEARKIPGLIGKELVESYALDTSDQTYSSWIKSKLANVFVGRQVVSSDSASRYFPNSVLIPASDHVTIAKPDSINHRTHAELLTLAKRVEELPPPECDAPPYFKVQMDIAQPAGSSSLRVASTGGDVPAMPVYSLVRTGKSGAPMLGRAREPVSHNPDKGVFEMAPDPPFPCAGQTFEAKFLRGPAPGMSYATTAPPKPTALCFSRSRTKANERTAGLKCAEGDQCAVSSDKAGLAEICGPRSGFNVWPNFFSTAHAEPTPIGSEGGGRHWVVPSLETIQAVAPEKRAGFTEFVIETGKLAGTEGATHYAYGVRVNGVPIYFDGWPPFSFEQPYAEGGGIRFAFAVENLGLSGGEKGYEKIEVELRFFAGDKLIRTEILSRDDYVSYRHAPRIDAKLSKGDKANWYGLFRPAKTQDRFEVMLAVEPTTQGILKKKQEFKDRTAYDGNPMIGVVRPGRADNPWLGLSFGLQLQSGQVRSSFTKNDALAVCRFVLDSAKSGKLPRWVAKSAYLYEFDTERITDIKDRGVYIGACSKFASAGGR